MVRLSMIYPGRKDVYLIIVCALLFILMFLFAIVVTKLGLDWSWFSTTILQVQQSVEVLAGRVAPWFGQIGGGIQYQLGTPLDQLIREGSIKIFGG